MGMGLKPGDIQNDKEGLNSIKRLAENMVWLIRKIKA